MTRSSKKIWLDDTDFEEICLKGLTEIELGSGEDSVIEGVLE